MYDQFLWLPRGGRSTSRRTRGSCSTATVTREAFNHILFGIRERKGFIQVTGEGGSRQDDPLPGGSRGIGSGPTSTALILNPCMTSSQLLRTILTELGIPPKGRPGWSAWRRSTAFLLDQLSAGKDVVLFIDEAQGPGRRAAGGDPAAVQPRNRPAQAAADRPSRASRSCATRLNERSLRQLRQRITVRYHPDAR